MEPDEGCYSCGETGYGQRRVMSSRSCHRAVTIAQPNSMAPYGPATI